MLAIFNKLLEQKHQVIAGRRVKAAGWFIKNQKLWIMAHCYGNRILYLHTGTKLLKLFILVNFKTFAKLLIKVVVPLMVKLFCNICNAADFCFRIKINSAKYIANLIFYFNFIHWH